MSTATPSGLFGRALFRKHKPRHSAGSDAGRRHMRTAVAASALAATALGGQLAHAPEAEAATQDILQVSQAQRLQDQQRMLDLINQYRASHGLAPVKFSQQLSGIVQEHSDRQITAESFWHSTSFMTDSRAGRWTHTNEIIALSYRQDVAELVNWWKTSPAHNAAMLSPRAEVIGIGLSYADGSLSNTGKPWRLLSTVNLYGYANGGAPADTSTRVTDGYLPQVSQTPGPVQGVSAATYPVYGGIGSHYHQGGGSATFGQPIMAEANASYGGRYQVFSKGGLTFKFLWSPGTGAHWVKDFGAIGQVWSKYGMERGLGYPTTDEYRYGNEMRQNFSNGYTLAWNIYTKHVYFV